MRLNIYGLAVLCLLLSQTAALSKSSNSVTQTRESETSAKTETVVISDSFEKEQEQIKQQIDQSLPEDQVQTALPPSGRVMSKQQKQEAGQDATKIVNQAPNDTHRMKAKNANGTPTIALALGGGGARGAAHIGVLKVLEEEGIIPDQIVGNSMGAIIGGLYSAGVPLNDISSHLEDLSLTHAYMPGGLPKKVISVPFSIMLKPFRPKHYPGLWSGKKLTRYLDKILPRPNMDVGDTKIPFSAVATNLLDGKAYRITKGRLSTAIKASAAIPPLIQPVAIDDKLFIDGGLRANLPASAARDTGAGLVIAVLVDEPMQVLPAKRFLAMKNIVNRMSDVVLCIADERQLQFADIVINPNVSDIEVLSNDPKDVQKAIDAGAAAARKALPELRKRLQLQVQTVQSTTQSN